MKYFCIVISIYPAIAVSANVIVGSLPEPVVQADFTAFDERQADIGRLLFYDPVLSGNRNISCGTCHHHDLGTTDGLSLGIGEGGEGIGENRTAGQGEGRIKSRIPRNTPALWNLAARQVDTLFHDGRVSTSDLYGNGFNTPAQEWLPAGLDHVLAAQALFPMTSRFEMAGDPRENQVGGAIYDRVDNAWSIIEKRVRIIPQYGRMFVDAFDDVNEPTDISITHIANAIAAFEGLEWISHDSPFDAFLAGDADALAPEQQQGMELFYGKAGCAGCHEGKFFSDQGFYALALPAFGPGRTRNWDPYVRDMGRIAVTDRLEDAYRFRTPSLRNVTLTAPYGHNGAYPTLEGIIRHHLQPARMMARWNRELSNLPKVPWLEEMDFVVEEDAREQQRLASRIDIESVNLNAKEIRALVLFLHSLTGTDSINGRLGRPETVPSGLEVDS